MHESKIMPRERVIQQTVEEVVEISVPMTQGNIVLMPTVVTKIGIITLTDRRTGGSDIRTHDSRKYHAHVDDGP